MDLGIRYYEEGFIKLYLDGVLQYPKKVLEQINIHYENNDIYYSFNPIEHGLYKGYYYIPYFSGYYINKKGDVVNSSYKKINVYTTKPPKNNVKNIRGGYKVLTIYGKTNQVHRLLCLTFKKYNTNPKKLFVNHIDGNGGNNNLNNLEWVTPRENLIHALNNNLMPNSVRPVISMCLNTGNVKSFNTVTSASKYHNMPESTIYNRLARESRYKKHTWNPDGIIFKHAKNNWWEIPKKQFLDRVPKSINAYDILYKTNTLYISYLDASRGTGVNTTSISSAIRNKITTPIKKRFIFTLS